MCENLRTSQSGTKANGDITFNDSLWMALKNPEDARAVFKRRIEGKRQLLSCGKKTTTTKRSLGIEIKPLQNQKVTKKPRLSQDPIDRTIAPNEFIPPVASTPAVNECSNRGSLEPIEEEHPNHAKSPQKSKIPVLQENFGGSPHTTSTRRSSINPTAMRAILQNAGQYSPKTTPQKRFSVDADGVAIRRTLPKNIVELDERLKSFTESLARRIAKSPSSSKDVVEIPVNQTDDMTNKSNYDVGSQSEATSISIVEILDSTTDLRRESDANNPSSQNEIPDQEAGRTYSIIVNTPDSQQEEVQSSVTVIELLDSTIESPEYVVPGTPCPAPAPALDKSIPENDITIPETQVPKEQSSQVVLDLRLRRSKSVPIAIDLRVKRTRTSSESGLYEAVKDTRRNSKRCLSKSLRVSTVSMKSIAGDVQECSVVEKSPPKLPASNRQPCESTSKRKPCESEVPRVSLEAIIDQDVEEETVQVDVHRTKSISPVDIRAPRRFSTPQILKKIGDDIRELIVTESQNIIGPPKEFKDTTGHTRHEDSELFTECLTGNEKIGQFQKVGGN